MLSKAYIQYPHFRFREEGKLLWNPVLKTTFKNRPEERVRLKLVEYLIREASFPGSKISFESPVKLRGEKSLSRTDLICYDPQFKPQLLVECKAPDIKLNEKTAMQVARYNSEVSSPYVMVTNGVLDFWFETDGGAINQLIKIPDPFSPQYHPAERDENYWNDRGFTGSNSEPGVCNYLVQQCEMLFTREGQPVKFLSFDQSPAELSLSHYYRIFGLEAEVRVALSISATPSGGTRLNAVLNEKGDNTAFFSCSLDLLAGGQADNTHLQSAAGTLSLNLTEETTFTLATDLSEAVFSFKELLTSHT